MTTALIETAVERNAQSTTKAYGVAVTWATVLGLVSGLACVGVRLIFRLLQWVFVQRTGLLPDAAALLAPFHRAMIPIVGASCATVVLLAARRWSRGEPFLEYVEAVRFEGGCIPFSSTMWRTASSAFSVASGAAVGREGSMIQFAAAVTSWLGGRLGGRFGSPGTSLARQVSYGAAAAVSAAYQAPLAGVFFAFEIVLGEWSWVEVPPLFLAAMSGWVVSHLLLGGGPLFPLPGRLSLSGFVWTVPLALLLAACGPGYQVLLRSFGFLRRLPAPLVWAAAMVGLLSIGRTAVWGNGDVALQQTLTGVPMLTSVLVLILFRVLATTVCIGAGTVGGVFTPTLYLGAALGLAAGHLLHASNPVLLAVVGMSTFLAAVTHAPWMAAFMTAELTGQPHLIPVLLLLNLAAKQVAGRISPKSLYAIATPSPARS